MFGAILVMLLVAAIVGSYMTLVNRMLRSDEHWSEWNQVKAVATPPAPKHYGVAASPAHA